MANLATKAKPNGRWSQEQLRRRGVRAVVDAMRLNKEHRLLSCECACYVEEGRLLRRYVQRVGRLTGLLRKSLKRQMQQHARSNGNGNAWTNHNHYQSPKPARRKESEKTP